MTKFNTCWIWKQHFNDYNSLEEGKVTSFKKKKHNNNKVLLSCIHTHIHQDNRDVSQAVCPECRLPVLCLCPLSPNLRVLSNCTSISSRISVTCYSGFYQRMLFFWLLYFLLFFCGTSIPVFSHLFSSHISPNVFIMILFQCLAKLKYVFRFYLVV